MFDLLPFERRNHMSAYNPFRDFEEFERNFFNSPSLAEFKTDIKEDGNNYILEADLPGFKKEDIDLSIDNDCLTIKAQRHSQAEEKDKKGNYIRCERSYGMFSRSFDVSGIDTDAIEAKYNDGVLTLTLPKKNVETPQVKKLDIK